MCARAHRHGHQRPLTTSTTMRARHETRGEHPSNLAPTVAQPTLHVPAASDCDATHTHNTHSTTLTFVCGGWRRRHGLPRRRPPPTTHASELATVSFAPPQAAQRFPFTSFCMGSRSGGARADLAAHAGLFPFTLRERPARARARAGVEAFPWRAARAAPRTSSLAASGTQRVPRTSAPHTDTQPHTRTHSTHPPPPPCRTLAPVVAVAAAAGARAALCTLRTSGRDTQPRFSCCGRHAAPNDCGTAGAGCPALAGAGRLDARAPCSLRGCSACVFFKCRKSYPYPTIAMQLSVARSC